MLDREGDREVCILFVVEALISEVPSIFGEVRLGAISGGGGGGGGGCGVIVRGARRARRGSVAMVDED